MLCQVLNTLSRSFFFPVPISAVQKKFTLRSHTKKLSANIPPLCWKSEKNDLYSISVNGCIM